MPHGHAGGCERDGRPYLDTLRLPVACVEARHGGKRMPPFQGRLSDAQITAVAQAVSGAEGGG